MVVKYLVHAKLQELTRIIEVRRKTNFESALALVMTHRGKELMDDVQKTILVMQETEQDLRMNRIKEREQSYQIAMMAAIISSLLGVILALGIAVLLWRADQLRRKEAWFQAGQVGLSKAMLGDLSLEQLGQQVLQFLAEYFDAQAGAFFTKQQNHYVRTSLYGIPDPDKVPKSFAQQEGLLGQAVQDARVFMVHEIPEEYIKIGSALGQSSPRHLIIAPVLADNTVNAVIELGFIHALDEQSLKLLDQVSSSIGIAVQSANYRENLQKLLEETRSQAEELQVQSEEIRASNEELEEQSHILQESQAHLEQQQADLEQANAQLEEQKESLEKSQLALQQRSRQLELSSKYKSEFLANMSHELRTPLNSLLILAHSLADNEEGNLTAEQVEEAKIIHNGGLELLSLINDILDLSKVEAGKLHVIAEDISIKSIVKRMKQQFDPVAKVSGVEFEIRVAENLPETVCSDVQRLEQVLKNLLSNAFKFTKKGSVTLDIKFADQSSADWEFTLDNGIIAFAVMDTGIGIEESKLSDIFEAFQQENGSTDRHYGGTGLGLTIARKFARILGGEIQVSSQKGQGSVFTLLIPKVWHIKDSTTPSLNEASGNFLQEPLKNSLKILPRNWPNPFIADDRDLISEKDKVLLIIEDDKIFAATLEKVARKRGYKCLVAGDGKTGLLLTENYPVSAIILDLKLPDTDGINILNQLKKNLKTRNIPVHIMTGRDYADHAEPLRKGAIGYLTKPVKPEEIDTAFSKIEDRLNSAIKTILVVEDDKKTQIAIQSLLKKKDITLVYEGLGETALRRMANEKFDCIILDLALPDMSGFEWLKQLDQQNFNAELPPIIIYTAQDLTEEENLQLSHYTGSIVIKGVSSSERLLDEITLFLHSVELTLTKDQQAMIRMQHDPNKVLLGRTVLLVDDDMRNIFALSKLLKKRGVNILIADNGQMALDKLQENPQVELVIMDIMMPVMDGYQAMQAIRANPATQALAIIALTARAMPEEQSLCMQAGANDYMVKPVDVDQLLALMRVWLFRQEVVE